MRWVSPEILLHKCCPASEKVILLIECEGVDFWSRFVEIAENRTPYYEYMHNYLKKNICQTC